MLLYNQATQGEKFDGRLLFHDRRNQVHLDIIKWSQMAVKDHKYLGEWIASLMALHRMMWGSFSNVKIKYHNEKIPFNTYMQTKLRILHKKIMDTFQYVERANGEIYIKADREKLKGLYLKIDEAQKEIAIMEYQKNFDLPKTTNAVDGCTTGGM